MNKFISTLTIATCLLLGSCQKNGTDPEVIIDPPVDHICVGAWKGGIGGQQLFGLLPRDILIDVKINNDKDSTYSLIATYAPGTDTSMKHLGSWHLNAKGDSIILVGNDCQVIDTTQKKLVTRDCGQPIPIYINIQNNAWKVLMTDLLPVASTLQINIPNITELAKRFEITLLKK
ncbi:MAG TPA: hypothetical protein VHO70_13900 [Chitinispirillaceae bacterium]|nr:hypothetical protein [Chitinispirillaceae bacterium]